MCLLCQQEALNHLFPPAYTCPRLRGGGDLPLVCSHRFFKHACGQIQVLQPVGGWAHSQQMDADLWKNMTGERESGGGRQRAPTQPACHATDLHHIRHHQIRGPGGEAFGHIRQSPPVLAELNERSRLLTKMCVSSIIVSACWLLEPDESFLIQQAKTLLGFGNRCDALYPASNPLLQPELPPTLHRP